MDFVRSIASSSTTFFAEGRRVARYFVVGGLSAAVDIGLFMLFAKVLALPYLPVSVATFLVATLINYALSIRFVFVSGHRFPRRWEIVLVYAASMIGLAINTSVLWMAVEWAGLPLLAAKVSGTASAFGWNYLSRRVLIFGPGAG